MKNFLKDYFLGLSKYQSLLAIFLLLFFFVISVFSVREMHTTTDEPAHYEYGLSILRGDATRQENSLMPISAWNALPAKIASYFPKGSIRTYLEKELAARIMTVIFSLAVAVLIFHWTRQLYGFVPAIIALMLYVLDPNIIAHSGMIATDIYAAGTIAFSVYWLWKFVNRRTWQNGLLFAIALGLSQLAKYTAIVLYPLFAIALIVSDLPVLVEEIKVSGKAFLLINVARYIKYALVVLSISILMINIGFLFNRTFTPLKQYEFRTEWFKGLQSKTDFIIPTPYPFLFGLDWTMYDEDNGAAYGNIYLLGKIHSVNGFNGYYIVAAGLKMPIAAQIIVWAALIVFFLRKKMTLNFLKNEWLLLLPVAFYALYFNFFYNGQIGIRHYLVVFPLIYIFAGSLFRDWMNFTYTQRVIVGVLVAYLAASTLFHYPNYLSYFNEFIFDPKMAYKYLADSNIEWGQDLDALDEYLENNEVYHAPAVPGYINRTKVFYIGVNELVGVTSIPPDRYAWLAENFEPTGMIAPSYLLFEITPKQMQYLCETTDYCR